MALTGYCVLASLLLFDSQVIAVPWNDDKISVGCFFWGWTDPDANELQPATVNTIEKCVAASRANSTFTLFKFIAGSQRCYLGSGEFGGNFVPGAEGDITGPSVCDFPAAACTATLKSGSEFPGETQTLSMNAWTTGFQPQAAQCWERKSDTTLMDCSDFEVIGGLDEVKKCGGLTVRVGLDEKQCENYCKTNLDCSVWVIRSGQCYTGLGRNCFTGLEVDATAGQRVMHGNVRNLARLNTKKVTNTAENVLSKEDITKLGDKALTTCEGICKSAVECQMWQLVEESGCWIEYASGLAAEGLYPLTKANFDQTGVGFTVKDGGLLQHFCGSQMKTLGPLANVGAKVTETVAASGASSSSASSSGTESSGTESSGSESSGSYWPWWAWVLLGLLLFCCIAALIAGVMALSGLCDKKGSKKKRALKRQPKVDAAPAVQQVTPVEPTQQVYLVQQQAPVPTTVAQVPTYQVAPVPAQITTFAQPAVQQGTFTSAAPQVFQQTSLGAAPQQVLQQPVLQQVALQQPYLVTPNTN